MIEGFSYDFYLEAASYIRKTVGAFPDTAVILGTGCGPFCDRIEVEKVISYRDIPNFPVTTNPGHRGELVIGKVAGKRLVCMNGRFHYYEGYSMEELSIPVHVLSILGVRTLILTCAAGSCNENMRPGSAMIITDHIKLYEGSPMRGPNVSELGPRFFSVSDLYTSSLVRKGLECAKDAQIKVHQGVYMFFPGPQFETKAEIRAARILGADAIGMSTVTEALTAAHCGMALFGLALVTNMANGMTDEDLDGSEVDEVAMRSKDAFSSYLESFIRVL